MRILETNGLTMVAVMIIRSIALGVSFTFSWSWNPKIGILLFRFSINDVDLRELCGKNYSFLNISPSIESMTKTEGHLKLKDS